MLDLILKIFDRLIDLSKRREQANRQFFDDFVSPLFEQFEAVHNDYVTSFSGYRNLINTSKGKIDDQHPVLEMMRKDSVFSAHNREKISINGPLERSAVSSLLYWIEEYLQCLSTFESMQPIKIDEAFSDMKPNKYRILIDIIQQLAHTKAFDPERPETELRCNAIRSAVLESLIIIFQSEIPVSAKKKLASIVIDRGVSGLQYAYGRVNSSYSQLKTELLPIK